MRILSALLIAALLLLTACGGDETPTPAPTVEVTPTPAVAQAATPDTPTAEASTAVTETTEMTDTTPMTETAAMTETAGMTETTEMTETESMTSATEMTETGALTGTPNLTTNDLITNETAVGVTAVAMLQDAQGNPVGQATFTQEQNIVTLQVELQGFTAADAGEHGLHIHTTGACTPDFGAAGGHFNPSGAKHGLDNAAGPHAGDLPNIELDADGNATYEATNAMITLGEGNNSLFDSDGSALVVHAGPDDMTTDPAGNSGDRLACGVIEKQ